jgi:hypothetical protein
MSIPDSISPAAGGAMPVALPSLVVVHLFATPGKLVDRQTWAPTIGELSALFNTFAPAQIETYDVKKLR